MTAKGHCKFDVSEQDSEFAELYDFSEPEVEAESDIEGDADARPEEETPTISSRKLLMADKDSIHLPSGRIISRKSSAQAEISLLGRLKRRNRTMASRIEYSAPEPDEEEESNNEALKSDTNDGTILSRREKREKAMVKFQLSNMSANDRTSLMHLSAPQQRSMLAMQHRQAKKVQKEEQRRKTNIDRKGNKNLYAYWATETPVYLCG
jgi:pre-60S factor REI1